MTRQELENSITAVIQNGDQLSTVVYAVMKNTLEVKKLNIDNEEITHIQQMFLESINNNIIQAEGQGIIKVSEADDRANTVFEYDIDLPDDLQYLISALNDNIPIFSFDNDDLGEIDSLIIEIGTEEVQLRLLKKLFPVEVFNRGGYRLWKSGNRLERFEDKVLTLTPKFDALYISENIIFMSLKLLERSHGFHDVIVREATLTIQSIADFNLLTETQNLLELLSNVRFARKVLKIRNSPVIRLQIPNDVIIEFTKNNPSLRNKFRYSDDGTQINLHTKKAKELFLKLMDDVFLNSELTKQFYESIAKDEIIVAQEGNPE